MFAGGLRTFMVWAVLFGLVALVKASRAIDEGVTPCWEQPSLSGLPFCDPSLPPDERSADLVSRMSNAEKFSLVGSTSAAVPRLGVAAYQYHTEGLHGLRTVCNDLPGLRVTVFPQW